MVCMQLLINVFNVMSRTVNFSMWKHCNVVIALDRLLLKLIFALLKCSISSILMPKISWSQIQHLWKELFNKIKEKWERMAMHMHFVSYKIHILTIMEVLVENAPTQLHFTISNFLDAHPAPMEKDTQLKDINVLILFIWPTTMIMLLSLHLIPFKFYYKRKEI